jgi:hypothetical protein
MLKAVALSTAEAEYYSASQIAVDIVHLRDLIQNMVLPQDEDTQCMRITQHASRGATISLVVIEPRRPRAFGGAFDRTAVRRLALSASVPFPGHAVELCCCTSRTVQ